MDKDISEILKDLADSVTEMDDEKAVRVSKRALELDMDAYVAISQGLARGMEIMGNKYQKGTCFVPELLLASDAMYAGINVLKPCMDSQNGGSDLSKYTIIIGVIEGDIHDIGKNLVKIMLEATGFRVVDMGADVPLKDFIDTAVRENAHMICISSMMSTTMLRMGEITGFMKEEGIRDQFKVMVGGACVTPAFANQMGADGYAVDAPAAVLKAKELLNAKNDR